MKSFKLVKKDTSKRYACKISDLGSMITIGQDGSEFTVKSEIVDTLTPILSNIISSKSSPNMLREVVVRLSKNYYIEKKDNDCYFFYVNLGYSLVEE